MTKETSPLAALIAWCREGVPALIALATAQAAQITGLEAERNTAREKEKEWAELAVAATDRGMRAITEAATLRAEVERLRGALSHIESMTVHSGGEIHGVAAQHWKAAFEEAQEIARAALEGKA